MSEYGFVIGYRRPVKCLDGGPFMSIATAREIISNYERYKPNLPAHDESQVAVLIGPAVKGMDVHPVGWHTYLPYVGKHRRSE